MNKKEEMKVQRIIRGIIQLLFFVMFPEMFQVAFTGVKYIVSQMHESDKIELTSFVICLILLILFTIIFGRFFCGFACAFGSLGDAVYAVSQVVQKKLNKKLPKIPVSVITYLHKIKYILLAVIIILCFMGAYKWVSPHSPWTVFSKMQALEFKTAFSFAGIVLFILIVAGMCIEQRFFCQFLCPMGAIFALLPTLLWSLPKKRRDLCIKGCTLCTKNCPVHIEAGNSDSSGECIECYRCVSGCPGSSMHIPMDFKVRYTFWVIFKAAILFLLFIFILR